MRFIILSLMASVVLSAGDFISDFEYGQMLYANPRGVSCVPCHGSTGKGKKIVTYRNKKGKRVTIQGPDITKSSLEDIKKSIREGKGVMPRYFLTDDEAKTIYEYIHKVNPEPKSDKKSKSKKTKKRKEKK